ncbi:MAG: hypothetical protein JW768_11045, partial [Chitinispirillaceae bacterium]|nr:hypothetical protein [Chitinispirillaceae bacterium]
DSVAVTLSNVTQLEWDLVASVRVSYTLGGGDSVVDNIPISQFERSIDIFTKVYVDPRFDGEEKWVFWEVVPIGIHGNRSVVVSDSCMVGMPRPPNTVTLAVGSVASTRIGLKWNRPATPVDSIRLWYGFSSEVPLHYDIPAHLFGSVALAGSDTSWLFTGLAASQTYHFGLQVKAGGLWSYVTEASRVSVTTLEVEDTVTMANLLRLLSLSFDTTTNSVVLQWMVDTAGLALEAGVVWSQDSLGYPMPNPPLVGKVTAIPDPSTPMVYSIPISSTDLLFNNDYYFAVWLRKINGLWLQPTPASVRKLHIPLAVWESIVYFRNTDTVVALANQIVLRKVEDMLVEAVVRSLGLPVETSGCIPVSIAFRFEQQNAPPLPLYVGLRYKAMPSGYTSDDIRMYHFLPGSNTWVVDTLQSEIDTGAGVYSVLIRASDCVHPFILMIDTVSPDIAVLNDSHDPVPPGQPLPLQIRCSDNIANAKMQLLAGRGDDLLLYARSEYADRKVDTVTWSVPATLVSREYGVRVIAGVSDGRFDTLLNASRDVVRLTSDTVSPGWLQWQPLGTPMVLDNTAIGMILREHADKNSVLRYDKNELRLFRWSANQWEEYSEGGRDFFRIEPTRVVWLKRRLTSPIYYGKGRTSSLRFNSRVAIPPRDWRDFCLPFRFNVRVGDVLIASGQTTETTPLHFYEWRQNPADAQKRYFAQGVFLPLVPGVSNPLTELTSRSGIMYTVYNASADTVIMQIPPTPKPLSQITGKRSVSSEWSVALHACEDEGPLNTVYCGFQKGGKGRNLSPTPPSWSDVCAGVYDPASKTVWGCLVARSDKDDGYTFELVFENATTARKQVGYWIERLIVSEGNSGIAVIDPETGELSPSLDSLGLVVPPNSRSYRWLAVGTSEYISSLNRLPFRGAFKLMRTMPNPFRQALRIQYEIPYGGIEWLNCTVFDPRGRVVWKLRIGPRIHPGKNEILWNPRKEKPMAAGTYIIQLSGFNGRNRKVGDRYTRVTYLP